MALATYSDLQTAITANWPNRTDLATIAPDIITVAEAALNQDSRVRSVQLRSITVSADNYDLPTDFKSLVSLSHDGTSYYGPIQIVGIGTLPLMKIQSGKTGAPRYAAVAGTASPQLRFAPVPDAAYTLKMTYDAKLVKLSDTDTTNWILTTHPNIYLYACLIEMERYLLEDDRAPMWQAALEMALDKLNVYTQRMEFGGEIIRRPRQAYGG